MFTVEERQQYIGGSDIAAVMGMNRWKTPLKLWLEKTGETEPKDLSENEAVQLGTELEEFVAQKFARITGKQVRKTSKMYVHKKYPYLVAHVDRLIIGKNELLECKTCGSHNKVEWEDEIQIIEINGEKQEQIVKKIPQEYILQCIWYMGIVGKKTCYIAVLIGGQKFKYRKIEFDKELFETMVETAVKFWNCVQTKTMPELTPNDNEIMAEIYPAVENEYIELQDVEEKIDDLQKVKADIKELETKKNQYEAELKSIINVHAGILTKKYKVSWQIINKLTVSNERLKADNLYEKYLENSVSRRFQIYNNTSKAA